MSQQSKERPDASFHRQDVMAIAKEEDNAVSVAIEDVTLGDWTEKVYKPDILNSPWKLYKKQGYNPL